MARYKREMYYEDGNTVRRYEAYPESPRRRREDYPQEERTSRRRNVSYEGAARKAEESKGFDLKYTAVLVFMLLMVVASCVVMITVQTEVDAKEKKIDSLRESIQNIEADNAAYENKLDSMYSLEDIYSIATGELGMVYSQNGQIIYYEQENGDYVKQYNDVPKTVD
ncbi:MAG: hypothetical protein K6E10_11525 [Eubacterium sp.]|nr:hypothetical protein [Eubacterium sp.]